MKTLRYIFVNLVLLSLAFSALCQDDRANKVPFEITFSTPGGFYDETLQVTLQSLPGATILYTLTGEDPESSKGNRYTDPISIQKNTVIRAIAIRGKERSKSFAESYFIGEPHSTFPVASLIIPPGMLFDPRDGMFRQGPRAVDSLYKKPGANYWTRLEVPAHLQLFQSNGENWFNSKIGFRVFGGLSRLLPQKSFAVVARNSYGEK
ncbi:MAG: chitobiase/beta-hexosaminidase C-terminal domain-containing protein, partial [Saprospiraceae bacterium]|nr:chitobiase/beta-hexosaminidase C-terminal domain-containing protein [Saprospiraceae bacterium]